MSASLRFLALAVVGWAGVRAATLGMVPGAEAFTLNRPAVGRDVGSGSSLPAIPVTDFAPLEPPEGLAAASADIPYGAMPPPAGYGMPALPVYYYPAAAPVGYPPQPVPPRQQALTPLMADPGPVFYSPLPQLDEWPLSQFASAALPARRSATTVAQQSVAPAAVKPRLDRLQLTAWALLRGAPAPGALASGGTLGGSQAGARLTYYVTPQLAASLRTTSPVGGGARGGEVAAGVRLVPFRSIPVALTAERRQAIGRYGGGRNAFALFLEGGVYQQSMPWGFDLDAYAQAGVVGARSRDLFADGALTLTRPVYGRFSAGIGVWGGMQPGVYRVDAGPRVSMRVRNNMRVHFDWRQRVAGNALPASGPAVTLAGDF